jgi:hypothetical protein
MNVASEKNITTRRKLVVKDDSHSNPDNTMTPIIADAIAATATATETESATATATESYIERQHKKVTEKDWAADE